jgi:uncharacterized protein YbjT (DUF2867 family)
MNAKERIDMILILGATGAVGGMVTRRLLEQGKKVRILVREGSDFQPLVQAGAQPVVGDLKDRASLDRAAQGVETVLTTANSAGRGGDDTVDTVEIQGNRGLIDAARAAGVTHVIFTSGLGAAVDSQVPFLRGKGLAEQHLKASGMEYTILTPNVFMEMWFGMIIGTPLQNGQPVTIIGEGNRRHSFVSMGDVASFAVAAVDTPAARNRQIFVGGPEPLSWNEVVTRAGEVIGREIPVRRVPPGESLPGLPDVVTGLATGMDQYDSPIDMTETAATFGITLTRANEVLRRLLGSARG